MTAMLALVVLSMSALAIPADRLFLKGSTQPQWVTIVSEDFAEVRYRLPGTDKTIAIHADRVDRIEYDDAPDAYKNALKMMESGDFSNAANNFRVALKSVTRNNWIKVYGNFNLALARFQCGAKDKTQFTEAAAAFESAIQADANSRLADEAFKRWGMALSLAGDANAAAAVYDRLLQETQRKKLGIDREAEALILRADAFARNDLTDEAMKAYREAGDFAESNAQTQKDAAIKSLLQSTLGRVRMSQGEAMLRARNYPDALGFFEQVASDPAASPESLAGALCGMGEVWLAEKKIDEAIEVFAAVKVKYHRIRNEAARATFLLGQCYVQRETDPNAERQAAGYFKEVVDRFSDTRWAALARTKGS